MSGGLGAVDDTHCRYVFLVLYTASNYTIASIIFPEPFPRPPQRLAPEHGRLLVDSPPCNVPLHLMTVLTEVRPIMLTDARIYGLDQPR